jgi:hypothetical protein
MQRREAQKPLKHRGAEEAEEQRRLPKSPELPTLPELKIKKPSFWGERLDAVSQRMQHLDPSRDARCAASLCSG